MSTSKATNDELNQFVSSNDEWSLVESKLQKTFTFKNFKQAFAFMTSVANYAEEVNHHPEWFNVYKTVKVDLTTHEVSGVSERDFKMAKQMDMIAQKTKQ